MPQTLYLDLPHVLMDFASGAASVAKEVRVKYAGRETDIPGLFGKMDPRPGAVAAYHELAASCDVHLLSAPPAANPTAWADQLAWVARHLGAPAADRLVLARGWQLLRDGVLVTAAAGDSRGFAGEVVRLDAAAPDWPGLVARLRSPSG